MLRENFNNYGYIREYKNGNITIKFCMAAIEDIKKDDVLALISIFDLIDIYPIGDTYCISNWETGHTFYNCYSDLTYVFFWSDLEKLKAGKTIRLYATRPDEYDREIINNEIGG